MHVCVRAGVYDVPPFASQAEELRILQEKTPKDLWMEDLGAFLEELDVSPHS